MIVNQTPYPISFIDQKGQALICRYQEDGRQYALLPDIDITGLTASVQFVKPDNTFVIEHAEVVAPEEGPAYLVITIPVQATAVKGVGRYSVFITDPEDEDFVLYSAEGTIWADDHLITEDMIESAAEVYGLRFPQDFLTVENLVDIVNYVRASLINDDTTGEDTTWSSQKIEQEIEGFTPEPITDTATGNPITLTDAAAAPLVSCVATIVATQSGSGTPSPDNIRPITGISALDIDIAATDQDTPETSTIPLPSTCYGGEVDVVRGVTNGTHIYKEFVVGASEGTVISAYRRKGFYFASGEEPNVQTRGTAICDSLVYAEAYAGDYEHFYINNTGTTLYVFVPNDGQEYAVHVVYPLATPTQTTISPTAIRTLSGDNYITTNAESLSLEYVRAPYDALVYKGVQYSTNEQVVGKWIDGSTIYERTFDRHTNPLSMSAYNWYTFAEISEPIYIIDSMGIVVDNGNISANYPIIANYDHGDLSIMHVRYGVTDSMGYVTIRYIKQ